MMSLLAQRATVLMLRPAALMAEALLVPGGNVMIFAIPIAALALTASSIPVHTQYMMATSKSPNIEFLERSYVSALLYITLIGSIVLFIILHLIFKTSHLYMVQIVISTFLVEKFSDELTRFYEFQKKYMMWLIAQTVRSAWLLFPIVLYISGYDYEMSFYAVSSSFALLSFFCFFFLARLRPSLAMSGWVAIRTNAIFLSHSFLLAIHRQVPRIVVAFSFPGMAHFFQILAQAGQAVSLLFNVRFVVPYRAIMSRHPLMVERRFSRTYMRLIQLAIGMLLLAAAGLLFSGFRFGYEILLAALAIAMIADALAFSLMSTYWGYLPWLVSPREAFVTSGFGAAVLAFFAGAGYVLVIEWHGPILVIPCLTVLVSIAWAWMIRRRHFRRGS